MHTLVSKIVALSVEKYYTPLTVIQWKICRFPLARNVPDPCACVYRHTIFCDWKPGRFRTTSLRRKSNKFRYEI